MTNTLTTDYSTFRALHQLGNPLLLSNVWDVAAARLAAKAGAHAVATTSAGTAWSLGLSDGNHLDQETALEAIGRIARAVELPVTADIENGYASCEAEVEATVRAVIELGVAGINIEDGTLAPQEFEERIAAARRVSGKRGEGLFINARTDVFLNAGAGPEELLAETVHRAQRYLDAGADGIFVPGLTDPQMIKKLVQLVPAPVNIMVGPGSPSVTELATLKVARISLGSGPAQAAYATAYRATHELLSTGTYRSVEQLVDYGELNELMLSPTER